MKNYRLKDVHLENGADGKIFVAIGGVYDETGNGFKTLTNNEIVNLLNDAIINSSKEYKLNKSEFRSSLSDFRTIL